MLCQGERERDGRQCHQKEPRGPRAVLLVRTAGCRGCSMVCMVGVGGECPRWCCVHVALPDCCDCALLHSIWFHCVANRTSLGEKWTSQPWPLGRPGCCVCPGCCLNGQPPCQRTSHVIDSMKSALLFILIQWVMSSRQWSVHSVQLSTPGPVQALR